MLDATEKLLEERGKTHGDFSDHARITQRLKNVIREEIKFRQVRNQPPLSAEALESLDMNAHKVGRILAGKWDEPDHWDDIAGYSKLVSQRIKP